MDVPKSAKLRHESVDRIEPTRLDVVSAPIADVVAELSAESAALGSALHPRTAASLAQLVRIMNAYYSNLIEGHKTRPRDIQRALAGQFDEDEGRRNLQLEATAHVAVQAEIDRLSAFDGLPEPASGTFIQWLHREFYRDAPVAMLKVRRHDQEYTMRPGEWRSSRDDDVVVGRHHPPSSARIADFMQYFEERYRLDGMGKAARIIAIAVAHHRLNYIHPFPDGNGRVSRLMSHAMGHAAGIGAHGLWSVSRGLARGLENPAEYKMMMDMADTPRENDFDGRGNLSRRALSEFVLWFLRVCLEQVRFMTELLELNTLARRLRLVAERDDRLRPEAGKLLEAAAIRGEIERGEASRLTGLSERTARRMLNETIAAGFLASETSKSPVFVQFPSATAEALFPRLFLPE